MPSILSMPSEIIAEVLRNLDNVNSILPALLSCRRFYSSFKEHPGVSHDVLEVQSGALMPYLIATSEAALFPQHIKDVAAQQILDTLYENPTHFLNTYRRMTINSVLRMGRTDNLIRSAAERFASDAWKLLGITDKLALSGQEHYRVMRAFYRFDLFSNLFRGLPRFIPGDEVKKQLFFARYPPWENEQIACVHDFLEMWLSDLSLDTVAHDVEFGHLSIDYLNNGPENVDKQCWVSQGIKFFHSLEKAETYEGRKDILSFASANGSAYPYPAITTSRAGAPENTTTLETYTEAEIEGMIPRQDAFDLNKGPYLAWWATHRGFTQDKWVMCEMHANLRLRAYVFWDDDRLEKYKLRETYADLPLPRRRTQEELQDMQASFVERNSIWERGGQGYWSRGDLERISWS